MDSDPRQPGGHYQQVSPGGLNMSTPSSTASGRGAHAGSYSSASYQQAVARDGASESPQQASNLALDDPDHPDSKKARACEACRGLKVRCDPDPNDGPCKRCKKAGRNCVVTMPTRKRQKKTDNRVSELEKKIDALTASLAARVTGPSGAAASTQSGDSPVNVKAQDSDVPWNGHQQPEYQRFGSDVSHKRKAAEIEAAADQGRPAHWPARTEGDIVERGLVPMEMASDLFLRYTNQMVHNLPGIILPPTTTVAELRRTKPILFHAIMAAASGENNSLQRVLQKELMYLFAEKVIVTGEKSLELVQALCVAVIWYWPPEYYEELKFYQLIHIACVMGVDIGLGRKAGSRASGVSVGWKQNPIRRSQLPDPTTLESRRTWLTCYYLAANTAISLHRPNLIRWTPFMAESQELLETSPNAAPTDKYFCHLVWTHHLGEETGLQFSMDDPSTKVDITDSRTQYSLRVLERDFERHVASVPPELMRPTLRLGFDVLNLYMHEMVLHTEPNTDQLRPPFDAEALKDGLATLESVSPAHVNAISACLKSIEGIFETFLGMSIEAIRCLPVFNYVRVAYAVVVLMKMHFSTLNHKSELGAVIGRENMRVQHYLDALMEKFRLTAVDDKCRPASKFLVVLAMLRSWFMKQGKPDTKTNDKDKGQASTSGPQQPAMAGPVTSASTNTSQAQAPVFPMPPTANTPLQLLSEIATTGHDGSAGWNFGVAAAAQNAMMQDSLGQTPPSVTMPGDVTGNPGTVFPPWITQALLSDVDVSAVMEAGSGVPRAMEDFPGVDQAWYMNSFQGLPDPNLFPF